MIHYPVIPLSRYPIVPLSRYAATRSLVQNSNNVFRFVLTSDLDQSPIRTNYALPPSLSF